MFGTELADRWDRVVSELRDLCADTAPDGIGPTALADVYAKAGTARRLVDGALTRLGPAYESSGAWHRAGAKSVTDAMAQLAGTTPAEARRRLDTGARLVSLPRLDAAVQRGEVSAEQATVIAGAAAPGRSETELIEVARTASHRTLTDEAARHRARADTDEEARRRRQVRLRRVHRWNDDDGMSNLHLRCLPAEGAEIDAHLKPEVDRIFAAAGTEGRRDSVPTYAADAVVGLLTGARSSSPGRSRASGSVRPERKVIALVDVEALNRGRTEGDETCELAGVGPVPVSAVRALVGDAATAVVFRDAVDVRSVVHLGRQLTAVQRTALEARGARCAVVGCGSTHQLEIDHAIGWTYTGVTQVDDLDWLCSTDHAIKTRRNLIAIGPPGARQLVERDPDDPTQPRRPLVVVRPGPGPDPPGERGLQPSSGEPDAVPEASFQPAQAVADGGRPRGSLVAARDGPR